MKLVLVAALAALSPLAGANDRVDVLTGNLGSYGVTALELDAGGAIRTDEIALQSITPFVLPDLRCIERIGNEVWVGGSEGILRYGGTPLAYIDRGFDLDGVNAISRTSFGAILCTVRTSTGTRHLVEVDANGNELNRVDTGLRNYTDIDPFPGGTGGYIGVANEVLVRLNGNLDHIADFAPDAGMVANQNNTGYFPDRITILDDGRIVVAAVVSIAIIRPDETVEAVVNPTAFEQDVHETGGGLLLVPSAVGLELLDPDSLEFFPRQAGLMGFRGRAYGTRYASNAAAVSGRGCTPTPNSTGAAALIHVLADTDASARKLSTIATDLPASTTALPIYGPAGTDQPLGGGRLCVSPAAPGIRRGPVTASSATGSVRVDFDFVTPGLGAQFLAGTTWYHQILFRDAGVSGIDGTDGVFVTFAP